ncbi:MAG: hypothetical protein NZ602_00615, partial [Thermoguttaceae bacterium]|nr:hypothetical protein [Thermoguttaceae bacterium]
MKASVRTILLYLAPWLVAAGLMGLWFWLAEAAVPRLIEQAYHQQSLTVFNRIIKDRTRPVEFYLEEWHHRRKGLFGAALAVACAWAAGAVNLAQWLRNRQKQFGRLSTPEIDQAILLLVLAVAGGVYWLLIYPLIAGHVYLYDDLAYLHLPLRSYYSRSLQEGRLPTWCPELFCGFDAHGEGQGGFFHPAKLALYGLLPLELAFNIDTVLAYPAAFGGMWFFLRRRRLWHGPAALGGMTYSFSAYLALRLNHTNVIQILAHLPWLLGCLDILLCSPRPLERRLAGAAVAVLTASQLLLGYPPSVWYSGLAELAYLLIIGWGRRLPGTLLQFGAAKVLGLLLAGLQVLPTLAQIPLSQRAQLDLKGLAVDSLIPWNFFQWLSPYAFAERTVGPARPWEFAQYAGLLGPVGFLWLLMEAVVSYRRGAVRNARHRPAHKADLANPLHRWLARHRDGRLVVWAGLMGLLGVAFALGAYGPMFWLLAPWPPFSFFRCWARYSLWIFVGLSVGVAVTVQGLSRRAGRTQQAPPSATSVAGLPRRVHWILAIGVVLSAMPLVLAKLDGRFQWGLPWASMAGLLFGPLGLLMVWWLLHRSAQGRTAALLGLVGFHMADLACYDITYWLTRCRFDRLENFIASIHLPPDPEAKPFIPVALQPNGEGLFFSPLPSAGEGGLRSRPGEGASHPLPAAAEGNTPPHPASPSAPPASAARPEANIQPLPPMRLWTEPAQEANVWLLVGRRSAGGWWGGLVPRQTLPYPDVKALRVAGVAWWKKSPFEPQPWQAVPDPLPEIRLVPHALLSQDPAKDLPRIDPASTVLLDRPGNDGSEWTASLVIPAQAGIQTPPLPAAGEGNVPPHLASPSSPPDSPARGEANIHPLPSAPRGWPGASRPAEGVWAETGGQKAEDGDRRTEHSAATARQWSLPGGQWGLGGSEWMAEGREQRAVSSGATAGEGAFTWWGVESRQWGVDGRGKKAEGREQRAVSSGATAGEGAFTWWGV